MITSSSVFSKAKIVAEGEAFLEIPLKDLAIGSYEWLRVSLSYQNYQIKIRKPGSSLEYDGTLESFVGFNTYIGTHSIGNTFFQVDANKPQGRQFQKQKKIEFQRVLQVLQHLFGC